MENNLNNKAEKASKSKDNKSYKISRNSNTNKNKIIPHNTFSYQTKPIFNSERENENENQYSLNIDNKFLSTIFNYNFDNAIEYPNSKNESVLNFQKFNNFSFDIFEKKKSKKKIENFSPLFQYGAQYIINDIHSSLCDNIKSIIKIQSCVRGFLFKKKLIINNLNKAYFEKKSLNAIIKIQKNLKGLLGRINIRKIILIKHIFQRRKSAIELIIKRFKYYLKVIKIKKKIFIEYYLEQRKQKANYIQDTYKNYKFYKEFKKLKKEIDKSYFLYYPNKAKKVEIIIYLDDGDNNNINNKKASIKSIKSIKYSFSYNKLLKYFILLIDPCKIFSGKYKCQFVVNDIIIFDKRYPTIQCNNCFFNIIELIPRNNFKCNINSKQKKKIKKIKKSKKSGNNNLNNSTHMYLDQLRLSLEDIKEEEDEGRSVTSKDNRYEKRMKDYSNRESLKKMNNDESDDSFDFTEEEYNEIKKISSRKNCENNSSYQGLKKGLKDNRPITVSNFEQKIKSSFK